MDVDIKEELSLSESSSIEDQNNFEIANGNKMEDSMSINDDTAGLYNADNDSTSTDCESTGKSNNGAIGSEERRETFYESDMDDDDSFDAVSEYMNKSSNKSNFEIIDCCEIPPQHMIETRLSRCPTSKQMQEFKKLKVIMRSGPFNKKEDAKITKNFEYFCKVHDVENSKEFIDKSYTDIRILDQPIRFENLNKRDRLKFARILAHGLNDRYLYSVYARFLHLVAAAPNRGRFTQAEDFLLVNTVNKNKSSSKKFIEAAELLQRSRQSVTKRYYLLTSNEHLPNDLNLVWTKSLTESFLKHLLKHCEVNNVQELRNVRISFAVYESISQIMQISPTRLRGFWLGRLSSQLFCEEYVTLQWIRIKLIKLFYKAKIKSRRDIQWNEVALLFNGLSPLFLWQKFDKLVKHRVPERFRNNFEECLKFLYNEVIPQLKTSKYDRELRRCTFTIEEGLKFINDENDDGVDAAEDETINSSKHCLNLS